MAQQDVAELKGHTSTPPPDANTAATANGVDDGPWKGPFRLFDLPSELRIRIYEMALAPTGVLHLTANKAKRRAVHPVVVPQLLATCRQINHEADGILLGENEVCITANAHDACWPAISEARLPTSALKRLQHFYVVLDCTDYFNASYADIDLDAFEALTSINSLRIAMVFRKHFETQTLSPLHIHKLRDFNLVAQILERVPASTTLRFGTEPGTAQHDIVQQLVALRTTNHVVRGSVREAPAADLEAASRGVSDLVRGRKSRAQEDVFRVTRELYEANGTSGRGAAMRL